MSPSWRQFFADTIVDKTCIRARLFPTPPHGGINTPNFRTASYLDNPPNISQALLNIIITFEKYEQYLVYVMFIVDSDGGYLFIEFCIKNRKFCMKFRYLILRKIIKLLPPDVRF